MRSRDPANANLAAAEDEDEQEVDRQHDERSDEADRDCAPRQVDEPELAAILGR